MAFIDRPRKKWRVRWRDPDGRERSESCATQAAAKTLLADVQVCEDTGRIWEPQKRPQSVPLSGVAADWIRAQDRRLARNTTDRLAYALDAFLSFVRQEHGDDASIELLSRRLVESYWDHLRTVPGRRGIRAESTCRKEIEAVMLLWSWAYDRADDYADLVPRPRPPELPRAAAVSPRPAPTWAEMDAAIGAATRGWHRALFALMRCTGLRVSQALRLEWSHIDRARGLLNFPGELGKSSAERVGRVVPLPPVLLEEMAAGRIATWDHPVWVVGHASDKRRIDLDVVDGCWRRAGVREAVWQGRPAHAFRAGFQTGLRAAGARFEATEYLVGHAQRGLDAHYIDPVALGLEAAVGMVPAFRSS